MRYRVEYQYDSPSWGSWFLKGVFPDLNEAHWYSRRCEQRYPDRYWRVIDRVQADVPKRYVAPKREPQ